MRLLSVFEYARLIKKKRIAEKKKLEESYKFSSTQKVFELKKEIAVFSKSPKTWLLS